MIRQAWVVCRPSADEVYETRPSARRGLLVAVIASGMKISKDHDDPDHRDELRRSGWARRREPGRPALVLPKSSRTAWVRADTGFQLANTLSAAGKVIPRHERVGDEGQREDQDERGVVARPRRS